MEQKEAERRGRDERATRFEVPNRCFRLFGGPLAALEEMFDFPPDPPNLWWPEDQAWCVGTDIDLMTTYVGASSVCVEALLGDDQLEVLGVPDDQSVTWEADTVNPLPEPP